MSVIAIIADDAGLERAAARGRAARTPAERPTSLLSDRGAVRSLDGDLSA